MFQDFSAPSDSVSDNSRLTAVRNLMEEQSIDFLIVPHADEQRNEYQPACSRRLAWLSGFTGSAGAAIISADRAVLFVDGRYTLQAANQVGTGEWEIDSLVDNPPHLWLGKNAGDSSTIGIDPWLHTSNEVDRLTKAAHEVQASLKPMANNAIDAVWQDRPPAPLEPTRIHPVEFAGRNTHEKMAQMDEALARAKADMTVLTDPSSVSWLFNIRGNDVAHTPVTLAHAILIRDQEPLLFIDKRQLDMETHAFLNQVATLAPPSELEERLADLSAGRTFLLDPDLAPHAMGEIIRDNGGKIVNGDDPARLPRAIKNETEINGSRNAHRRDGAAVTTFLHWLDQQEPGTIDEISAAARLEKTRADMAGNMPLKDVSFDTISGSGPNGAIVHYRVDETTNRVLQNGELYLVDSGAQHDDGTTDITRTVAIGDVGNDERRAFTLVLRGHIAIAAARFPKGTRGMDLDPSARMPLWQHGMDYAHGTGHGVGSYLSVHEGPQSISRRGTHELHAGMIVSNEPGYYRSGAFGIRIENLVLVHDATDISGGDQQMLGFETLTLAPIDSRLIDPTMLNDDELHWLNAYHGWVRREISPLVDDEVRNWLHKATEPMIRDLPPASA